MGQVTLSFDNGPDPVVTDRVLDVLARRDLKASFFAVGDRLADPAAGRALVRAREAGHLIGNHTFTHGLPLGEDLRADAVEQEIIATERALAQLGLTTRLFRPHGKGGQLGPHLLSRAARDYLAAEHYTCVMWNCVPGDWRDEAGWVDTALAACAREPETLVVLHDYVASTAANLDRFCGALLEAGHSIRQAFPRSCLPMRDGIATSALVAMVA